MRKELTYEDVSLFSRQISTITSRFSGEIDLSQTVMFGTTPVRMGLIMSAPMLDITGLQMCTALGGLGQLGILHRFMTTEEQTAQIRSITSMVSTHYFEQGDYWSEQLSAFSVGINDVEDKMDAFSDYVRTSEITDHNFLICIDTANGASALLKPAIEYIMAVRESLSHYNTNIEILAGNVVTHEAATYLYDQGVKFIRVGISGGSACSTSEVTGIYRPLLSAVEEIAIGRRNFGQNFHIVADGGIKTPADMLKALAVGADFVMVGGLLAGYDCSNSDFVEQTFWQRLLRKPKHKHYRGMASVAMAQLNNKVNGLNKTILAEGVERTVKYRGELRPVVLNILNSISSSFSYCNARNIEEFRKNVEIVEITYNSAAQRKPHFGN